jgi:hypothetical protein
MLLSASSTRSFNSTRIAAWLAEVNFPSNCSASDNDVTCGRAPW